MGNSGTAASDGSGLSQARYQTSNMRSARCLSRKGQQRISRTWLCKNPKPSNARTPMLSASQCHLSRYPTPQAESTPHVQETACVAGGATDCSQAQEIIVVPSVLLNSDRSAVDNANIASCSSDSGGAGHGGDAQTRQQAASAMPAAPSIESGLLELAAPSGQQSVRMQDKAAAGRAATSASGAAASAGELGPNSASVRTAVSSAALGATPALDHAALGASSGTGHDVSAHDVSAGSTQGDPAGTPPAGPVQASGTAALAQAAASGAQADAPDAQAHNNAANELQLLAAQDAPRAREPGARAGRCSPRRRRSRCCRPCGAAIAAARCICIRKLSNA